MLVYHRSVVSGNDPTQLREKILQVSLQLGTELGAEGLTMRAIAKRLGVSATALYQHFESKAAILRAIRFEGLDRMYAYLQPIEEIEDPVERLIENGHRYVRFALDNPWLYSLLLEEEELDFSSFSPEEVVRVERPTLPVKQAIEDGKAQGKLRPDVDEQSARFMMWAALHGLASLMLRGRIAETHPAYPISSAEQLVDASVRAIVRGLQT